MPFDSSFDQKETIKTVEKYVINVIVKLYLLIN